MFQVRSGKVRVTDPCYTKDTWCSGTVKALNGEWTGKTDLQDQGSWGTRNVTLTVQHKDHGPGSRYLTSMDVGVDSGQAGVFDEAAYPNGTEDTGDYDDKESFYGKACAITLGTRGGDYLDEIGFLCSSGFGDGNYNADIYGTEDGQATKIVITFIEEEEDEEDFYEEDEDNDDE